MYRTLLQAAFFYSTRPYLPDDDTQLWMLAGCESRQQWERHSEVVRAMFTPVELDGARLSSRKRLLTDWNRIEEKRQVLAENGRKGRKAQLESSNRSAEVGQTSGNCPANAPQLLGKEVKGSEVSEVRKKTTTSAPSALVPVTLWMEFVEMRKKIRKPMTDKAVELIHRELLRLKGLGHDPVQVLEQSIRNGWQDVFPVREDKSNVRATDDVKSFDRARAEGTDTALRRVLELGRSTASQTQPRLPARVR
jgi:hypothetical protein